MCTVILLIRPGHAWPVLLGTNRDEMADRPWLAPGRHWPDRDDVVAGQDALAGGSWLGVNDHGVVAGILNRHGELGPSPEARSRGELVLEALDHADAAAAARALTGIAPQSYRPFNMFVADNRDAAWIAHRGGGAAIAATPLPAGFSMLTAHDLNDRSTPRIRTYLPRLEAAAVPDPETGEWAAWESILASREFAAEDGLSAAMNIVTDFGFATLSSSLIAIPASGEKARKPIWRFAAGRPDEAPYQEVAL